jgi:hypothetical protein
MSIWIIDGNGENMSTEKGVVEKIENEFAWVRAQRKSACAGCSLTQT